MIYTGKDKNAIKRYLEVKKVIGHKTESKLPQNESDIAKSDRKARLLANFFAFAKYYFPHYVTEADGKTTEFGWFHRKAINIIQPDTVTVLEWAREHAKSVFADVMLPLWLYAKGEMTGMVIASATFDKAAELLSDVQAELEANELWIYDYGALAASGSWETGEFQTTEGIGFWAFGLGQSPRGIRVQNKRPNYAVVDDADTKERSKNVYRVSESVEWIMEDLFGALGLKNGVRFVIAGNRFRKDSIIANVVGDVNPEDPKNPNVQHLKVYAIENPRTHAKADINDPNSQAAWKERYTKEDFLKRFAKIGYIATRREYFHEHIEKGKVFKNDWITWAKCPPLSNFHAIVDYTDPSFKNNKDSDYKASITIGAYYIGNQLRYHIIKAWVRQASISAMVKSRFDLFDYLGEQCRYFIESNMLQAMLLDEFTTEGSMRGYHLPIQGDMRSKPDKYTRIENLTPLFERGLIELNEAERQNADMQVFINQLLAFPTGHDDAPDALEGGIFKLNQSARLHQFEPRVGKFHKSQSNRR
jgi:predicted phage terminase large subunit-like protein